MSFSFRTSGPKCGYRQLGGRKQIDRLFQQDRIVILTHAPLPASLHFLPFQRQRLIRRSGFLFLGGKRNIHLGIADAHREPLWRRLSWRRERLAGLHAVLFLPVVRSLPSALWFWHPFDYARVKDWRAIVRFVVVE